MLKTTSVAKVIQTLANEAPLTTYAIAKRSGVAVSLVHKNIKDPDNGLECKKIVRSHSEKVWRTGKKSVSYILTFRGLIEYFDSVFKRQQVKRSEIKKTIQKYGEFYDYPLFTESEFLEDWLGEKVYDWMCSTGWLLKNHPPLISLKINNVVSGSFLGIVRSLTRGRFPIPIKWEDEIWMYGFTKVFFDLISVWFEGKEVAPTPNPTLYKLVEETYEKLEDALEERLRRVRRLEEALKNQFSSKDQKR